MAAWNEDEWGTIAAEIGDWKIEIRRYMNDSKVSINAYEPNSYSDLHIDLEDGIYVRGESPGIYSNFPETVNLSWPVIEAIIEARDIARKMTE